MLLLASIFCSSFSLSYSNSASILTVSRRRAPGLRFAILSLTNSRWELLRAKDFLAADSPSKFSPSRFVSCSYFFEPVGFALLVDCLLEALFILFRLRLFSLTDLLDFWERKSSEVSVTEMWIGLKLPAPWLSSSASSRSRYSSSSFYLYSSLCRFLSFLRISFVFLV